MLCYVKWSDKSRLRHLWWFQIENNPLRSPWFIHSYFSALRLKPCSRVRCQTRERCGEMFLYWRLRKMSELHKIFSNIGRVLPEVKASHLIDFILFSITWLSLHIPANTTRWPNAGLMLAQRRRRWANISPALGQRVVFAGINSSWDDHPRGMLNYALKIAYPRILSVENDPTIYSVSNSISDNIL